MFQVLLSHIPWLQVFVAAIAYFLLGALWYGSLFSKAWIRGHQVNVNDPEMKKGVATTMITSFFILLITCIALWMVLILVGVSDAEHAIKWGAFIGFCFAFTSTSMSYLYLKKPISAHLIDGMYHVIGMIIASLILGLWK